MPYLITTMNKLWVNARILDLQEKTKLINMSEYSNKYVNCGDHLIEFADIFLSIRLYQTFVTITVTVFMGNFCWIDVIFAIKGPTLKNMSAYLLRTN